MSTDLPTQSDSLDEIPYGQFFQALQRKELAELTWVNQQIIVGMRAAHTNILVETICAFEKFKVSVADPAISQNTQQKIEDFKVRRNIGEELDSIQLVHLLKEISQMPENRKAKPEDKPPITRKALAGLGALMQAQGHSK